MLTFRAGTTQILPRIAARDSIGLLTLVALIAAFAAGIPDLVIVALFPVAVTCLSRDHGVVVWIFANRTIYSLGVWSYAIYLLHPLLQRPRDLMTDALGVHMRLEFAAIASALAAVALLLVCSFALYRCVEVPGRRAIQRMALLMTPRQTSPLSAAGHGRTDPGLS
jgi:peptidoglycan/LPS O-acetylase OafA/YrhL